MLKILKSDLEAEVPPAKQFQIDTQHLRYILVLKMF